MDRKSRVNEKISEANYKYLNEKKIWIIIVSLILFVGFSIAADSTIKFESQIVHYTCVAIQNVSITVFSVFLLEYVINRRYKEHFREDIVKVLTNPSMMEDFISNEKLKEIRDSSMEAIYGEKIFRKVQDVILSNYESLDENCLRKNAYIYICLSEDTKTPEFYKTKITVRFMVSNLELDDNFEVYCTADPEKYDKYIGSIQQRKGFLRFPFLMAAGLNKDINGFEMKSFKVNDRSVQNVSNENHRYLYPLNNYIINFDSEKKIEISFEFETYLNKNENYLFEDFLCVYDGIHIKLIYQETDIKDCKCYSSYKERGLIVSKIADKQIEVDLDDVILSGSFIIFIWNK